MDRLLTPVNILLVEDNPDDVEIMEMAMEGGRFNNQLTIARDGQEALDILQGHRNGAPKPGLILLDLNLPKLSGLDVLKEIKADPDLQQIPVIVLTASTRDEDVVRSYKLGVNTFISKPVEFDRFLDAVSTIQEYWLVLATLPPAKVTPGS
ncbi:MAG: response regulator [Chloroflexi bacterium]|nr:response regulator [Chloroflexota bacterium]